MNRILAKRYAFCDFSSISGYPHPVPTRDEWERSIPRFRGEKWEVPAEHLLDFHDFIDRLEIVHEDVQIKLFKFSLEGIALDWCRSLPSASVSSLADFHAAFHVFCKDHFPDDLLYPQCCHEFYLLNKDPNTHEDKHVSFEYSDIQEQEYTSAEDISYCGQGIVDPQYGINGDSLGSVIDTEGSSCFPDLQIKEDSPQLSHLLIEGICSSHEKLDLQRLSIFKVGQQEVEYSSYDELCEDSIEGEIVNEDVDENLSFSNSREEDFQGMIVGCTNDCMDSKILYPVSCASASDFSSLQKVSHEVFSPERKEEDREIVHFLVQDKGVLDPPVFDEYLDEEELIPTSDFADLKSSPPIYNSYEFDVDEEQYCEKISHLETPAADIEKSPPEISKFACTILEHRSADNKKQFIINNEVSLQLYSDLHAVEGGSHDNPENMQTLSAFQLKQQQEVFSFNFIDPFVYYLKSSSSIDVKFLLPNKGWLCCIFELYISILWFPTFIFRSEVLPVIQILGWLHWKHDFT
jgi:hypothetical protein